MSAPLAPPLRRLARALRRLRAAAAPLRRLARDARGVAAVEFAIILPVMVTLYVGLVQVAEAVAADRKATLLSRAISDLAARTGSSGLTAADLNDIFNAATAVLQPFNAAPATMRLTSVWIDGASTARVEWSVSRGSGAGGSPYAAALGECTSATAIVPAGLRVARTSVVLAEVSYNYVPFIGDAVAGTILLKEKTYMRPRSVDWVRYAAAGHADLCAGSVP